MYRDLTMKEISEQQIGQTLQVAGWVENIRDHGGVSFIDLRDMYGVLQVVIRKPELLKGITLGRRSTQDRGLDLQKSHVRHLLTQITDHLGTKYNVVLYFCISKVKITIF